MKNLNQIISALLLPAILYSSCQKIDLIPEKNIGEDNLRSAKKISCEVAEFSSLYGSPGNLQNQIHFKKSFANGSINKITSVVYSGGDISNMVTYQLIQKDRTISFIREGTNDTAFVVTLNSNGQVTGTRGGNKPDFNYLPTSFTYSNARLTSMKINFSGKELVSSFNFQNGNLRSIQDQVTADETPGRIEYEYGVGTKVSKQLYFDEPRKFSWNTFTLLQFMGFFPELDGESVRTRTTVYWENNYKAYDRKLINHQIDGNGRLMQYAVSGVADGEISMRYLLDWNCSANAVIGSQETQNTGN